MEYLEFVPKLQILHRVELLHQQRLGPIHQGGPQDVLAEQQADGLVADGHVFWAKQRDGRVGQLGAEGDQIFVGPLHHLGLAGGARGRHQGGHPVLEVGRHWQVICLAHRIQEDLKGTALVVDVHTLGAGLDHDYFLCVASSISMVSGIDFEGIYCISKKMTSKEFT